MVEDLVTGIITDFFNGGWRVAPFSKTPDGYIGVKGWPKRAATNAADLQLLVEEKRQQTSRDLVFGIVPPKGRYIVDIDTKKNSSALQLWKDKVAEAYGTTESAYPDLVVKTKSGGFHLYYSDGSDRQIHSPTSIFSKESGIDIRGITGMVIAPTTIGTEFDWQFGDYTIIRGRPTDPLVVLGLSKILGDAYDEADVYLRVVLTRVNESLRNDSVHEMARHMLLPDDLIIPSSSRDNTLYRCARLCRLAGISQEAAVSFMIHLAHRCEATPEEPLEHWIAIATDKVKRVFASATEMKFQTTTGFFDELDNAGLVALNGVSRSYYYFRYGSKMLNIEPRSRYAVDNFVNVIQGISIEADDAPVPVRKLMPNYTPKQKAFNTAMYPKANMPYFDFEDIKYANTYYDPFAAFEPTPSILERALPYLDMFNQFTRHITGYEDGDDARLLDKLAWIVQRPYRRLTTGTIIYSHMRGSGKDLFMSLVREIVGRPYYMPITLKSIESPHVLLHDKLVCTASEVQLQTNARGNIAAASFMGRLKDLVTAKTVYVDEKFIQPYSAPIFANIFILSNFELSSILEPGDRRFDVFHATEEKLDQSRFSTIADITNDGKWIEKTQEDRLFRKHVIYALRKALYERSVDESLDSTEAVMNPVKTALLESQNPPAIEWMAQNLPPYFTEEVAMMACHFCPMKIQPEYVLKKLREHLGTQLKPLYRSGRQIFRLNGSPRLELRTNGSAGTMPILSFGAKTSDASARRAVYFFDRGVHDTMPADAQLRKEMAQWYETMVSRYYGNVTSLPGQKPDVLG